MAVAVQDVTITMTNAEYQTLNQGVAPNAISPNGVFGNLTPTNSSIAPTVNVTNNGTTTTVTIGTPNRNEYTISQILSRLRRAIQSGYNITVTY